MTKEEKLAALTRWLHCYQQLSGQLEAFQRLTNSTADSPMQNPVWRMFDAYTDTLATLLDDQGGWLNWFIWENKCGKNGFQVSINAGPHFRVRTLHHLLRVIEGHKN